LLGSKAASVGGLIGSALLFLDANAIANHSADSGQDDRRWYTEGAAESCYPYSPDECSDERANDYSIDRPTKLSRPRLSEAANRVSTAFDCMLHFLFSRDVALSWRRLPLICQLRAQLPSRR
jgi:hypothetical protein